MPSGPIALLVVAPPLPRCKRFFPFLLKIANFPICDQEQCRALARSHNWRNSYDRATMPAKDSVRDPVKKALIQDGWAIAKESVAD